MGAMTSWSLGLALLHHALVQYSAFKAGSKERWFSEYALLGDDLVIADDKVKDYYLSILSKIGVSVN